MSDAPFNRMVLAVREDYVTRVVGQTHGVTGAVSSLFDTEMVPREAMGFRSRVDIETDEHFLQPLPYACVFDASGRLLAYNRGKGGAEARLRSMWSVGVGGHIDMIPDAVTAIRNALVSSGYPGEPLLTRDATTDAYNAALSGIYSGRPAVIHDDLVSHFPGNPSIVSVQDIVHSMSQYYVGGNYAMSPLFRAMQGQFTLWNLPRIAMNRELLEELGVTGGGVTSGVYGFSRLLFDTGRAVGRVHMGLNYTVTLHRPIGSCGTPEIDPAACRWLTREDIRSLVENAEEIGKYERWSQMLLEWMAKYEMFRQ